jgi:hypothetical protein
MAGFSTIAIVAFRQVLGKSEAEEEDNVEKHESNKRKEIRHRDGEQPNSCSLFDLRMNRKELDCLDGSLNYRMAGGRIFELEK